MKKSIVILQWIPRVLCILSILFVSMFALDSFAPGLTIWQQLGAFMLHMIPSFVLILILIVAWKRELIGGIFFMMIGLGFSPFIYTHNYMMNQSVWMSISIVMMITFPFFLTGVLFLASHLLKKKKLSAEGL